MMHVERTTTGVIIREASAEIKRKVLQYFSLSKPTREFFIYSGNDPDRKPIFGHERDVIYITSGLLGLKDPDLKRLRINSTREIPTPAKIELKMNREPRSRLQEDCIKKLTTSDSKKITIELKPGTGKAEPYSRKIPTPTKHGYTCMGDLNVGDMVFGRDGNPTPITGIFEQGEQDIYRVTFQDGRVAYCHGEHLWTVKSHKNGVWKTVMLKDMLRDFKRESPWKMLHNREDPYAYKYYIPTCNPVRYPHRDVPIDPWVMGCFIGNGCCTCKPLTISSPNDSIPNKIADICGFTAIKNPANYSYTFKDKNGHQVKTDDFFAKVPSMIDCHSRDKEIPEMYLVNDFESRLGLIQGLMDTDGSISDNGKRFNLRFTSTSKVLLQQVVKMLYSFGYSGTISEDRRNEKYIDGYCGSVTFRVPNAIKQNFFRDKAKSLVAAEAVIYDQENRYNDLLIKDIQFSHREKCRCIMVDNPDHLYLTEDFIVTHNTFIACYAASKLGLKPLIVAPTSLLKNQWIDNIVELGIDKSEIATRIYDAPDKKVCVVTISALEGAIRDDWNGLLKTLDRSGFGIKVIDEAHLHLKGMLKFDALCNIRHNWYMSATLGRSDPSEDKVLNRALSDADRFVGNAFYEEYQHEYVQVYLQDIYYFPSNKLCEKHFKYGSKGLIRSSYYNMLMAYKDGKPFINNVVAVVKRAKSVIDYDGKILVLVPLLSIIKRIEEAMKADPYFSKFTVASVDGSMPLKERQKAMEANFILSTSLSMGTGVDVSNLGVVVNFDQYSSAIIGEQIFGRLRDRGKETYYIDICDHVKQASMLKKWGDKRRMLIPYYPGAKSDMKRFPKIMS